MMIAYHDVIKKLRNTLTPVFGEAWSLSCPVPDVIRGIPVDKHFLYAISMCTGKSHPFALVVSDMETGTILTLKHCAVEDFVDAAMSHVANNRPHRKIAVKDYKDGMLQLRAVYENLRQIINSSETNAGEVDAIFERYMALLVELTPAEHAPYYAAMRGKGKAPRNSTPKNV